MPVIAIVGASSDRNKFGNKAVRAYLRQGWTVHPVHPAGGEIEGCPVSTSLSEVSGPLDRIALYLPPRFGLAVLDQAAAIEHADLIVNPGAESRELLDRARELGLPVRESCAILDVGENPSTL